MLFGYRTLVYCTSQISKTSFAEFISSLNDELTKHNWRVLVFCTESNLSKESKNNHGDINIFDLINYDVADAILLSDERIQNTKLKKTILENAKKRSIPVFLLDGTRDDTYNIRFDQKNSFEKIVKHIVEQHEITSLHFMAGLKDSIQSQLRLEAFIDVLQKNNIPFNDSMVSYGDFWDGPTKIATQKLIDNNRVPRAIICANDTMAIAVISVLTNNGFQVPRDVIVTGFDGIDAILYSNPKVSSINCNFHALAIETANYIVDVFNTNTPPSTRLVDGSLLLSESCGCQSITPSNSLEYISYITNAYSGFRTEDTLLSNLSSMIHDSKNVEELMVNMKSGLLYNCMCIVKAECVDENKNPNVSYTKSAYGEDLFLLYDSDYKGEYENRFFKKSELIPRMKEYLDFYQKPLIFAPLNNIEMPLGYFMFCFYNYDKQNYIRVNQITTWIGNAISAFRNVQYQHQLQTKIENMYSHDSLTELYNRNGFLKIYNEMLENPAIDTISLAMCDLDNLKFINDNFSHTEGDNAIRVVGKALSSADKDGFYGRYGGDEIIGLYTKAVTLEEIEKNVINYIEKYNETSGKPYKVSTSIGIYTSKKTSFEEMFAKADELMYMQKIQKKNRRK